MKAIINPETDLKISVKREGWKKNLWTGFKGMYLVYGELYYWRTGRFTGDLKKHLVSSTYKWIVCQKDSQPSEEQIKDLERQVYEQLETWKNEYK